MYVTDFFPSKTMQLQTPWTKSCYRNLLGPPINGKISNANEVEKFSCALKTINPYFHCLSQFYLEMSSQTEQIMASTTYSEIFLFD